MVVVAEPGPGDPTLEEVQAPSADPATLHGYLRDVLRVTSPSAVG